MSAARHERMHLETGDLVVVRCGRPARVRLCDDANLPRRLAHEPCESLGGFHRVVPARIVVPRSGFWNVTVEPGGIDPAGAEVGIDRISDRGSDACARPR